jgi:hypothetical protein
MCLFTSPLTVEQNKLERMSMAQVFQIGQYFRTATILNKYAFFVAKDGTK